VKFGVLVEGYLAHGTHNLRSQTISTYESRLRNHLLPYFSDVRVRNQVSTDRINQWVTWERHRGVSDKTIRASLVTLGAVMSYAVDINLISSSPCTKVKAPKVQDGGVEYTLTPEQTQLLIQSTPRREGQRVLMMFMCSTACRPSEAAEARWSDFSFNEGLVILSRTATRHGANPPKNGKVRRVPLAPSLLRELKTWKRESGGHGDGLVFPTTTGKRRDMQRWARDVLRPALTRAGLPIPKGSDTNYLTRKSWITNALVNQSISVKLVSELVGSSPNTLMRHYEKVRMPDAHDAMRRMDAMMGAHQRDTESEVA
jgi:integrase